MRGGPWAYYFSKPCLPLVNLGEDFAKLVQQAAHQSAAVAIPEDIETTILDIVSEETLFDVPKTLTKSKAVTS